MIIKAILMPRIILFLSVFLWTIYQPIFALEIGQNPQEPSLAVQFKHLSEMDGYPKITF